jgi:hypothetical protein
MAAATCAEPRPTHQRIITAHRSSVFEFLSLALSSGVRAPVALTFFFPHPVSVMWGPPDRVVSYLYSETHATAAWTPRIPRVGQVRRSRNGCRNPRITSGYKNRARFFLARLNRVPGEASRWSHPCPYPATRCLEAISRDSIPARNQTSRE